MSSDSNTNTPKIDPLGKRLRLKLISGDLATIPTKRALQVWLGYVAHANRDGETWPSIDTLAEAWGLDERTIRRGKTELIKSGHLEPMNRLSGERGTPVYKINLDPPDRTHAVHPASEPTGQMKGAGWTNEGRRVDNIRAQGGHPLSTEGKEAKESKQQATAAAGGIAAMVRLGVSDSMARKVKPTPAADTVIRHWLTITNAKDRTAVLVSRLRNGDEPREKLTPQMISRACREGVITSITLDNKTLEIQPGCDAKQNGNGVYIGEHLLPTRRIREAVFA